MINFLVLSEAELNGTSSFDIKYYSRELYLCGYKTRKIEINFPDIKKLNTFIFEAEKRQDVNIVFSDAKIDIESLDLDEYKIIDDIKVYIKNSAYFIFEQTNFFKSLNKCVSTLLEDKSKFYTQIFRCFGKSDFELKNLLKTYISEECFIEITSNKLLSDVIVKCRQKAILDENSRKILTDIKDWVYAESDISLETAVFELLKINNKTIAFAESITGGNIVRRFISKNPGASKVVMEGLVTYTNKAKIDRLGVNAETIEKTSAVSIDTAYEMATGLLKSADIVASITGYASGDEETGLTYIAISDNEGIHVFKNKFSGTREEIIENATNAVFFRLVQKLRQNDFNFKEKMIQ